MLIEIFDEAQQSGQVTQKQSRRLGFGNYVIPYLGGESFRDNAAGMTLDAGGLFFGHVLR